MTFLVDDEQIIELEQIPLYPVPNVFVVDPLLSGRFFSEILVEVAIEDVDALRNLRATSSLTDICDAGDRN